METKSIIQLIAETCDDKQAEDIVVLDMNNISLVADYFLICHASNGRQVQAIAKAIRDVMEENGMTVKHLEGFEQARWIIVDTGYVLCHIFQQDERLFYNLERLWGDANKIPLQIGQEKEI